MIHLLQIPNNAANFMAAFKNVASCEAEICLTVLRDPVTRFWSGAKTIHGKITHVPEMFGITDGLELTVESIVNNAMACIDRLEPAMVGLAEEEELARSGAVTPDSLKAIPIVYGFDAQHFWTQKQTIELAYRNYLAKPVDHFLRFEYLQEDLQTVIDRHAIQCSLDISQKTAPSKTDLDDQWLIYLEENPVLLDRIKQYYAEDYELINKHKTEL